MNVIKLLFDENHNKIYKFLISISISNPYKIKLEIFLKYVWFAHNKWILDN